MNSTDFRPKQTPKTPRRRTVSATRVIGLKVPIHRIQDIPSISSAVPPYSDRFSFLAKDRTGNARSCNTTEKTNRLKRRILRSHTDAPKGCAHKRKGGSTQECQRRKKCCETNRQDDDLQQFADDQGSYRASGHCYRVENENETRRYCGCSLENENRSGKNQHSQQRSALPKRHIANMTLGIPSLMRGVLTFPPALLAADGASARYTA